MCVRGEEERVWCVCEGRRGEGLMCVRGEKRRGYGVCVREKRRGYGVCVKGEEERV